MLITVGIFFLLYFVDQLSKYLCDKFTISERIIPGILDFKTEYNPGMAWGMFDNNTLFLTIISAIATIVLMYICKHNDWKNNKFKSFAYTLTLAGCVGNLFDRFFTVLKYREGVVDMISFKPFDFLCNLFNLGSTIFNVADAYLVIGVILLAVYYIFFDGDDKDGRKSSN